MHAREQQWERYQALADIKSLFPMANRKHAAIVYSKVDDVGCQCCCCVVVTKFPKFIRRKSNVEWDHSKVVGVEVDLCVVVIVVIVVSDSCGSGSCL